MQVIECIVLSGAGGVSSCNRIRVWVVASEYTAARHTQSQSVSNLTCQRVTQVLPNDRHTRVQNGAIQFVCRQWWMGLNLSATKDKSGWIGAHRNRVQWMAQTDSVWIKSIKGVRTSQVCWVKWFYRAKWHKASDWHPHQSSMQNPKSVKAQIANGWLNYDWWAKSGESFTAICAKHQKKTQSLIVQANN